MSGSWIVLLAFLTPTIGAVTLYLLRKSPNLREAASLVAAVVTFALAAALVPEVVNGARPAFRVWELLPGFTIRFQVEPLGLGFALIASSLWFVTVLYSIGYMRAHHEKNLTRFYLFFALAIAATIGAAFSANLLTLYVFYELLTLTTYPLVTHGGKDKDRSGGRTYIIFLFGTSLTMLLLAMGWVWSLTGTLAFVEGGLFLEGNQLIDGASPGLLTILFALFVFGTGKAAVMPFHRWLPAAMVAPTPVSALLHAVAVVKLGVFAILKVAIYTFGLDALTRVDAGQLLQYAAATTLLIAAVIAIREDNLKRRLAYSTISQLAYIVLAATLANHLSILAGSMHIAVHAFAKITLFFCAGVILVSLNKTTVSELRGVGRTMPITMGAWLVASFCVIGLPLTGGFWSKWYLAQGALEAGEPLMLVVVLLGSLLAMGYLLPPAIRAFYAPDRSDLAVARPGGGTEAPWTSLFAIVLTAILSVATFFTAPQIAQLLQGIEGVG